VIVLKKFLKQSLNKEDDTNGRRETPHRVA